MHPTPFTSILTLLKSLAATHLTRFALHGHGESWCWVCWDLESGGLLSLQTSLAVMGRSRVERGTTQMVPGSVTPTVGAHWTAWCGSRSPPCLGSLSASALLSLARLSGVMSTDGWERKSEQGSQCDCVCACVSVSDCWLLEYKWDVLIHLNQGHMLGPRVKCSERNEALYCICHSAQEIKPGTFSALHEILRVTFKQSVVINWLHDWPDCKSFSYFHVRDIFVVSGKWVIFGLFSVISSMFCKISFNFLGI